jgi:hypothetical protein
VNLGRVVDHDIFHLDHMHPFAHLGARGRVRRENPVRSREHLPPRAFPNAPDWGLAGEDIPLRPYPLKPGEAEAALAPFQRSHWGSFVWQTSRFAIRWLTDKAIFGVLRVVFAVPRLVVRLVPSLRVPRDAYLDAVRGHPLSEWPRRLGEERRKRAMAKANHIDGRSG